MENSSSQTPNVTPAHIFDMTVLMGEALVPCEVYFVPAGQDLGFTRVIMNPGTKLEQVWDIDREDFCEDPDAPEAVWTKEWVDIYQGFPGGMPELLGAAIDFKIREQNHEL